MKMEKLNIFEGMKRYPECDLDKLERKCRSMRRDGYYLFLAKQIILQRQTHLMPVVDKDKKIGFIEAESCKIVIAPCYDCVKGWFYDKQSLVAVKESKKWGVIDSKGETVIPFDYIDIVPPINSGLFAAQKWLEGDGAWGVIDVNQNQVVPFNSGYASIEGYDNGVCRVHLKDGFWAVLNEEGKEAIKFGEYDNILPIYDSGYPVVRMEKIIEDGKKRVDKISKQALAGRLIE